MRAKTTVAGPGPGQEGLGQGRRVVTTDQGRRTRARTLR
jgi:hypothetical protein